MDKDAPLSETLTEMEEASKVANNRMVEMGNQHAEWLLVDNRLENVKIGENV